MLLRNGRPLGPVGTASGLSHDPCPVPGLGASKVPLGQTLKLSLNQMAAWAPITS